MSQSGFKSGFVSFIGRPNVGKSTLMNNILGQKIAITSDKAQTTRNRISGIYTTPNEQIVFIDTPGVHKPKHRLGDFMVETSLATLNEVDVVLFVVNATEKRGPGDEYIMDRLQYVEQPVFLIINKIDEVSKEEVAKTITSYIHDHEFEEVIPLSALTGENVETLNEVILTYLEEGPMYYPEDQVTDHPESFIIREIIREKVLELTHEEIPHSVAVIVEDIFRNEDDKLEIGAVIFVERSSQKGIIIGKGGRMLREIGTRARRELEALLGDRIYLNTWVKVKDDWRDRTTTLTRLGYSDEDY